MNDKQKEKLKRLKKSFKRIKNFYYPPQADVVIIDKAGIETMFPVMADRLNYIDQLILTFSQ